MKLNQKSNILITCARGLSPFLEKEVSELGYTIKEVHKTGLTLQGSLEDCMHFNLKLRTAFNVLYELKYFQAANPDVFYTEVFVSFTYYFFWINVLPVGYIDY